MEGDSSKDSVGVGGVDEETESSIGVGVGVGESVGVSGAGVRWFPPSWSFAFGSVREMKNSFFCRFCFLTSGNINRF